MFSLCLKICSGSTYPKIFYLILKTEVLTDISAKSCIHCMQVTRQLKMHGRTTVEQLRWLSRELASQKSNADCLELSKSGLSVKIHFGDARDCAEALNQGYVKLRPGPCACDEALHVLWSEDFGDSSGNVSAVIIPADSRSVCSFTVLFVPIMDVVVQLATSECVFRIKHSFCEMP